MLSYDFSEISCDIYNGVSEFLMTAAVLQHLRLRLRLLSPHTGKVPAQPGIGVSLSRPGTSNSIENR